MSKGAFLAITGSLLWGIMGVACQYLLQDKGISAIWLVNMRMFFAGIILLFHIIYVTFYLPYDNYIKFCAVKVN